MKHLKTFEDFVEDLKHMAHLDIAAKESDKPENLVESFVNLDCTDPGGDDLIKFMKKHNIKMTIVNSNRAYPECKFVGKKDDLKKLITDFWDDEDLFDYIKESKEVQIKDFKREFRDKYSNISHSLSDKQIQKFLDTDAKDADMIKAMDLFQDYLLSQGLADDVQ